MKNSYLKNTLLCIKYPFLYPRNRWTGYHYTNWKLLEKASELYKASTHAGDSNEGFKVTVTNWRKYLCYKFLKWWHNHPLQWMHCLTDYTELDALEPGWRKAFGKEICEEIKQQLKKEGLLYKYRITQIKEKWGYLHWYDNGCTPELMKIINKYEDISRHTCIVCGKPATKISKGWISPYCDDCIGDNDYDEIDD